MTDEQQRAIFTKNLNEYISKSGKTQKEIAKDLGLNPQTVNSWCTGNALPRMGKIQMLADYFNIEKTYLIDDQSIKPNEKHSVITNLYPIQKKKFPLIGTIACGEPILADQNFEGYVEAGAEIRADFCIRAKGDSMKNIRIEDGDIVFIREQPDVENGEIAAVLIGDEATLKRINKNTPGFLFLMPENSEYEPIVINLNDNAEDIRILGKAVAFQSDIK